MQHFHFPGQTGEYHGKVRDVYFLPNRKVAIIASDRISAFDVILPRPIPFKGQILNDIAAFMLRLTSDVCPNWLESVPAPGVSFGKHCTPFKIEVVVRATLSGHAWRTYLAGKRVLCGVPLPGGLKENDFFPEPIITPSTKAEHGHDEEVSRLQIIEEGIVDEQTYIRIEQYARALFAAGQKYASSRGLILADTKYEFGTSDDAIYLIDEIHTPDSSRYFYADHFEENQRQGRRQRQLSKEFVREWLVANGFMGQEGQSVPLMTDDWVDTIQQRYIELYEILLGRSFVPESQSAEQIVQAITEAMNASTYGTG